MVGGGVVVVAFLCTSVVISVGVVVVIARGVVNVDVVNGDGVGCAVVVNCDVVD